MNKNTKIKDKVCVTVVGRSSLTSAMNWTRRLNYWSILYPTLFVNQTLTA